MKPSNSTHLAKVVIKATGIATVATIFLILLPRIVEIGSFIVFALICWITGENIVAHA